MLNDVRLSTLSNGLRIISAQVPGAESVAIGFWIGVGGRYEPSGCSGISHFLEHMVFKGTRRRSARAISNAIEGRGGYLNAFTQEENTCFYARVPHEQMAGAVDVLADMYRFARISPLEVERERAVILEEIRMIRDQPSQLVQDQAMQALWSNHALGRALTGTESSVSALRAASLSQFRDRYYVPRNTVVAFSGRLSHEACVSAVRRKLADMLPGRRARRHPVSDASSQQPAVLLQREVEQTQLVAGWRLFGRRDPRRFALRVFNALAGENMSSRLFQVLRERHGLAYSIHSFYQLFAETGMFAVSAGVEPAQIKKTLLLLRRELNRFCRQPVREVELRRAKDYLLGQFRLGMESPGNQMQWIGENLLNDQHWVDPETVVEGICTVSAQAVMTLAETLFDPDRLSLAVITPRGDRYSAAFLRGLLGPIRETSRHEPFG